MPIYDDVTQLIGRTPMVRLHRLPEPGSAEVLVKLESFNPGGSVKDRAALSMVEAAEAEGKLRPGSVIVEPTSGNTGIALAMVAAARGYRAVIVMPESASRERIQLLYAYGAEVVLSPEEEGMSGALRLAREIVDRTPGAFMPQQFENPANPEAHRRTTAPEILEDTGGRLDAFVASAGTGGTITGTGRELRRHLPGLLIVTVEPAGSPVLSGGKPGRSRIPGLGPGFIPAVLDRTVYDRIVDVADEEAWETTRRLAREEGLLCGPSSGAVVCAALQVAKELGPGKRVVAIAPDTGERYLSMGLFERSERHG
ncbi:MAG: cysteine synthase A [Bacillota bacterium]|nr:cysteine synthase A [Bacillota bacterium]